MIEFMLYSKNMWLFLFLLTLTNNQEYYLSVSTIRWSLRHNAKWKRSCMRKSPKSKLNVNQWPQNQKVVQPGNSSPIKTFLCKSLVHIHSLSTHTPVLSDPEPWRVISERFSSTFTSLSKLGLFPSAVFPCYYGHVTASRCLTMGQLCSSRQIPVRWALLMFRQRKWKSMENCIRPLNTSNP